VAGSNARGVQAGCQPSDPCLKLREGDGATPPAVELNDRYSRVVSSVHQRVPGLPDVAFATPRLGRRPVIDPAPHLLGRLGDVFSYQM
jgi:hypothetical protein